MTDPDEPFGRDMHQEPADEFFTGDGDLFPLSLVFVIFSSKGNSAVRHAFNTIVADRDPVGILPEIFDNGLSAIKRFLAVRDDIIRKNPSDGVMKEIAQNNGRNKGVRRALTIEEQRAFMDYVANHPVYYHWWPMFTILLGTGCRIGEALGLRWEDVDLEKRIISVNHTLVYYKHADDETSALRVSTPKTEAGTRTIPMLYMVFDAFQMLYEEQKDTGFNESVIDGMSGFVFCDRFRNVPNPSGVNRAIKRIVSAYNYEEVLAAKKEGRNPLILPEFSCHQLRHTFCTRLCENETNLKVIQSVMGHRDIATTMDIYAEATDTKKKESFDKLSQMDIF